MGDQKTLSTCRDSGILKKTVVFLQKKTVVMVALEQIFTPAVCQPSKFWKKWIEGGGGGGGVFENWGTYKFKESGGFGKNFFFLDSRGGRFGGGNSDYVTAETWGR